MTDAPSAQAMEDFFLNPTFAMQSLYRSDMSADEQLDAIADANDALLLNLGRNGSTPKPEATITDLREPVFWHGYVSEEEIASPVENDDLSTHSESDDSDLSRPPLPLALAASCSRMEHQCSRAHAVVLRPVGRAKVVAVPKPIDLTAQPRLVQPAVNSANRRSMPQLSRLRIAPATQEYPVPRIPQLRMHASRSALDLSAKPSRPSEPYSFKRHNSVNRRPSVPLVEAAAQAMSPKVRAVAQNASINAPIFSFSETRAPGSLTASRSKRLVRRDTSPTDLWATTPTTSPTASSPIKLVKRMNRLGSTITLNRFARHVSRASTDSDSSGSSSPDASSKPADSPLAPPTYPRRMSMPKMVARGGAERAPPIVLPPFPGEDDEDDGDNNNDELDFSPWPTRKASAPHVLRDYAPLANSVVSARA